MNWWLTDLQWTHIWKMPSHHLHGLDCERAFGQFEASDDYQPLDPCLNHRTDYGQKNGDQLGWPPVRFPEEVKLSGNGRVVRPVSCYQLLGHVPCPLRSNSGSGGLPQLCEGTIGQAKL